MKFIFKIACFFIYFIQIICKTNSTTKHIIDEDYYVNYDYEFIHNNSKIRKIPESLILPIPENSESRYTIDVLPDVELPDESLADTDLRDHDFIDNLMYVYYGSHNKSGKNYGPEIIIIGSVLSCAAQLLTIFIVLLRKNVNGKREVYCIFLQLMGCLCISNLIFMMGIYATKNPVKCQIIGLILYYLHLLTAFWLFMYVYYIYKRFCHSDLPKMQVFYSTVYGLPALLALITFLISPTSYETKKFCFVSVEKGMILNYMLPVSLLIMITTTYSLNGIRKINLELSKLELTSSAESLNALRNEMYPSSEEKRQDCTDGEITSLRDCKRCLRGLCIIQSCYDLVWFVAVLALENINYSNSMSIVYAVTSCLLNWYIFARTKLFCPTIVYNRLKLIEDPVITTEKTVTANNDLLINRRESSDNIPLLISSETEMREIVRHDYISTISS